MLTPDQKEKICNGCGSKGGIIKVPNFIFKASCNHHDFLYWLGCNDADRKYADDFFYKYMKIDISERDYNWLKRLHYRLWAYAYYKSVRLFGKKHFYYAEKKRTVKDILNAS